MTAPCVWCQRPGDVVGIWRPSRSEDIEQLRQHLRGETGNPRVRYWVCADCLVSHTPAETAAHAEQSALSMARPS